MEEVTLRCDEPAPGVVTTVLRGYLRSADGREFVRFADDVLRRRRRIWVFHDWAELSGYDPTVRSTLTQWALQRRKEIDGLHILLVVRSPVLSMAVAASNMILGGLMVVHDRRDDFERLRAQKISGNAR